MAALASIELEFLQHIEHTALSEPEKRRAREQCELGFMLLTRGLFAAVSAPEPEPARALPPQAAKLAERLVRQLEEHARGSRQHAAALEALQREPGPEGLVTETLLKKVQAELASAHPVYAQRARRALIEAAMWLE